MNSEKQFLKDFGKRIANLRLKQGLTQEQLAYKIDVHRTYVGYIVQGKRNPSIGNIYKITKVLKATLTYMIIFFN